MRAPTTARAKRKFPWHDDIELWVSRGVDLKTAQTNTILTWIEKGDLRPLADVITDGQRLEPVVLHCLASMIFKRTLAVKRQRGRGKPRQPGKPVRDLDVARRYEELVGKKPRAGKKIRSADAFQQVADEFRTTSASARKALTNWRKRNRTSRRQSEK